MKAIKFIKNKIGMDVKESKQQIPINYTTVQPKNPVVLLHGLFGFDKIMSGTIKYWNDIDEYLNMLGVTVFTTKQPISSSPWKRAVRIIDQLLEYRSIHYSNNDSIKFNLVGHSLGGIDARIVRLICPQMVESICTIATPHHGSSFADFAEKTLMPYVLPLFDFINVEIDAIKFLSIESMKEFNETIKDHNHEIPLYSFSAKKSKDQIKIHFVYSHQYIYEREGENDGLVSVKSATFGTHCKTLEADHLEQIGFSLKFRSKKQKHYYHHNFFKELMLFLADKGH